MSPRTDLIPAAELAAAGIADYRLSFHREIIDVSTGGLFGGPSSNGLRETVAGMETWTVRGVRVRDGVEFVATGPNRAAAERSFAELIESA